MLGLSRSGEESYPSRSEVGEIEIRDFFCMILALLLQSVGILTHSILMHFSFGTGPSPKFWGYLIYMKSVQARILILDCDSFKAWSYIQSHPLFLEQASSGNKWVSDTHPNPYAV